VIYEATMEIHLVEKTEKTIKISFKEPDSTLIMPILDELDKNKDVKIVRYVDSHPELVEPMLIVEMREGSPVDAVKGAAMAVSQFFSAVETA
jgi:DNA-directed RNA polymerase subunit L